MDLREIKNAINNKKTCYIPYLDKNVTITNIQKEDGKTMAICNSEDGKQYKIDIRQIQSEKKMEANKPIEFSGEKKEELERREQEVFEALRLLGKNSAYIKRTLKPEMKTAMDKTMMVKVAHSIVNDNGVVNATTRGKHYPNTGIIAYKIAKGLFPGDEELARGIQICAMYHDYGQCPFGHDGEQAATKASSNYNGGPIPHNSEGARRLYFREFGKLKEAINTGKIIEEEATKRIKLEQSKENFDDDEFKRRLKLKENELKEDIKLGLEPELSNKIKKQVQENGELTDEAIKLIITAAGNHNGERGTANITPDYSITFDDFWKGIQDTYLDEKANNKLITCNIADAITKLADQISSIPFDMIDGVRSGIEDNIPNEWVTPVSKILRISEDEAQKRLEGNEQELNILALELQDKLINSVIENSNPRKIDMSLAELLYGLNGEIGLRTPNFNQHIIHTSTAEEEILLDNMISDLTEKLSREILDDKGVFLPNINEIFRLSENNSSRTSKENALKRAYKGNEYSRDFYNYCIEISAEEYNFHKQIVKEKEAQYFRDIIENALKQTESSYRIPRGYRGSMRYAVETAIESGIDKVQPDKDGRYSDEKIKTMMGNINAYLRNNPVDGISNLNVTIPNTRYEIGRKYIEDREIGTDQQIAARIAISYLMTLNDRELLDLGSKIGVIDKESVQKFYTPYLEYSDKRNGGEGHMTSSAARAIDDYNSAIEEKGEQEK